MDDQITGSISGRGKPFFFLNSFQTDSAAHPTFFPMVTRGMIPQE
jgi:hypothetical protein